MATSPCPNCGAPLAETPSLFGPGQRGLECSACKTTFSDGAVTQHLFESVAGIPIGDVKQAIDRASAKPIAGAVRACPTCSKPLARFTLKGIELDLCLECGTTAFDPGELWRLTGGKLGRAPEQPKQGVFEMLWDCEHCDTKNLLGRTNRYCPSCGAPQDPKRRRFPEPGQEVAANAEYDGADHHCPACSTANGAKAKHCRHCGSPMDGSGQVKRLADQVDGRTAPAPAAPAPPVAKKRSPLLFVLGGLATLFCGVCGVATFWTKPAKATVSGHTWERTIDIERFGPTSDSTWCDSLPSGAYDVSKSRKQRSTNKVPDGETCTTRNVDRGDGTFERKQECRPKYKEEPVYDDHCSFKVDRWAKHRSVKAEGTRADEPRWPALTGLKAGSVVGSEREGARREVFTVELKGPKGERWSCDVGQGSWSSLQPGSSHDVQVRVLTGGVDCSTLGGK